MVPSIKFEVPSWAGFGRSLSLSKDDLTTWDVLILCPDQEPETVRAPKSVFTKYAKYVCCPLSCSPPQSKKDACQYSSLCRLDPISFYIPDLAYVVGFLFWLPPSPMLFVNCVPRVGSWILYIIQPGTCVRAQKSCLPRASYGPSIPDPKYTDKHGRRE